jgi:hypothetical protein
VNVRTIILIADEVNIFQFDWGGQWEARFASKVAMSDKTRSHKTQMQEKSGDEPPPVRQFSIGTLAVNSLNSQTPALRHRRGFAQKVGN